MVIVAAVDESERAPKVLEQAIVLAERFDDSVHLVHVMKRSVAVEASSGSISGEDTVSLNELRARAKGVAEELVPEGSDIEIVPVGLIGNPADEVIEYATDRDARYIVVSPQRRTQTGKMIFGSVAQAILLNASCPVVSLVASS